VLDPSADWPPRAVAAQQFVRQPNLQAIPQPVEIVVPPEAAIEVFAAGQFQPLGNGRVVVGLMVGQVYRLRITGIPTRAGAEVFPSIDLVDRLYAPQGLELKFPISVHIPFEDLAAALDGQLVTRVIYLENPELAIPVPFAEGVQPTVDVGAGDDPLLGARMRGRPLAIVRAGSRVPDTAELTAFGFGAPPFLRADELEATYAAAGAVPYVESVEPGVGTPVVPPDDN
jgi:hypothetical protein